MKRPNKVTISGHTKNPDFNDGYGIYEYTENGFLKSYSRFCDLAEKPWWVDKYQNNDFGLPIKAEMFLMGEYVRYDTYEYSGNNLIKHSVYDLKKGLLSSFDGGIKTNSVYEYDNDIVAARIDYYPDGEIIRNQYSWEEKDCSVHLINWLI